MDLFNLGGPYGSISYWEGILQIIYYTETTPGRRRKRQTGRGSTSGDSSERCTGWYHGLRTSSRCRSPAVLPHLCLQFASENPRVWQKPWVFTSKLLEKCGSSSKLCYLIGFDPMKCDWIHRAGFNYFQFRKISVLMCDTSIKSQRFIPSSGIGHRTTLVGFQAVFSSEWQFWSLVVWWRRCQEFQLNCQLRSGSAQQMLFNAKQNVCHPCYPTKNKKKQHVFRKKWKLILANIGNELAKFSKVGFLPSPSCSIVSSMVLILNIRTGSFLRGHCD